MKKVIILFILMLALLTGCSSTPTFGADNTLTEEDTIANEECEEAEEDTSCTDGDIEGDINVTDLSEDEILTEKAKAEHKTEEDTLVPQEELEANEDGEKSIEEEGLEEEGTGENIEEESEEIEIVESFNTEVPEAIEIDIKYDKYSTSYNYLLILSNHINIREEPTTQSDIVNNASLYEKMNLEAKVKGQYLERYNSDGWYKVFWKDGEEVKYGYVFEALGEPRGFQFSKMYEVIDSLKNEVENNQTAYISNYKNRSGIAPLYKGKTQDNYGTVRYQSAPAYVEADYNSDFRYLEDGTLISILEEKNDLIRVKTLNFEGEYWVPKKYISYSNSIEELTKVIVVDRKNQNEGVFEYIDGKWRLISYVYATTGEKAKYKQETSLGYFMAIQTRDRFLYLDDITREISGYAPYAIRFNGGAYIHGVPVEFKIVEGKRVDPGMKEYLFTIGSVPRSHKCVRNYTSHAKFLYDWVDIGNSAVIVIE